MVGSVFLEGRLLSSIHASLGNCVVSLELEPGVLEAVEISAGCGH